MAQTRRAVGAVRVTIEVSRLRHGHVEDEATARGQVRLHAPEERLDIGARVQVQERVERAQHQREALAEAHLAHVALDQP